MAEMLVFGSTERDVEFTERRAAYVVIIDAERVATVKPQHKHFLPGGGSLPGESPEDTIVREVREELARSVRLTRKVGEALQYFYSATDKRHYRMHATFFAGEFTGGARADAGECELHWLLATEAERACFHACHAWAVRSVMKSRTPISDCEICRNLSSHNYADLTYNVIPTNMALLTGDSPTERPADDIIECHLCGTLYSYIYTCGFGENDIALRRISQIEAGRDVDVDKLRRELASPHDDTKGYAAQCLTEFYLSEGMLKEAQALIGDEDAVIRSSAEASRDNYRYRKSLE